MSSTTLIVAASVPSTCSAAQQPPKLNLFSDTTRSNWNGVAISNSGRAFATFPRDEDLDNPGIVELTGSDHRNEVAFPGGEWNAWVSGKDPATHLVSLNAIYLNKADDHLWAVDTGAPFQGPALPHAAKLIEFNLKTNQVANVYVVESRYFNEKSHLNDMRIHGDMIYVTDSGVGSILTINRKTGRQRLLLSHSQKTKAFPNQKPVIDGQPVLDQSGQVPQVHADAIELTADGKTLYFGAPFGDPRLHWPDAYSIGPDGTIYFAVSQNGSMQRMNHGVDARKPPFEILSFKPTK